MKKCQKSSCINWKPYLGRLWRAIRARHFPCGRDACLARYSSLVLRCIAVVCILIQYSIDFRCGVLWFLIMKTGPKRRCAYGGHGRVAGDNRGCLRSINSRAVSKAVLRVLGIARTSGYICDECIAFGKNQCQVSSTDKRQVNRAVCCWHLTPVPWLIFVSEMAEALCEVHYYNIYDRKNNH